MNEGVGGPSPEDVEFNAEVEKSAENEPTVDEYLTTLEDWREKLDEHTFLSLLEEFSLGIDTGIGYLFTVAIEHDLDADELLRDHNLIE